MRQKIRLILFILLTLLYTIAFADAYWVGDSECSSFAFKKGGFYGRRSRILSTKEDKEPGGRYDPLACWIYKLKIDIPDQDFDSSNILIPNLSIKDMSCFHFEIGSLSSSKKSGEGTGTGSTKEDDDDFHDPRVDVTVGKFRAECEGEYHSGILGGKISATIESASSSASSNTHIIAEDGEHAHGQNIMNSFHVLSRKNKKDSSAIDQEEQQPFLFLELTFPSEMIPLTPTAHDDFEHAYYYGNENKDQEKQQQKEKSYLMAVSGNVTQCTLPTSSSNSSPLKVKLKFHGSISSSIIDLFSSSLSGYLSQTIVDELCAPLVSTEGGGDDTVATTTTDGSSGLIVPAINDILTKVVQQSNEYMLGLIRNQTLASESISTSPAIPEKSNNDHEELMYVDWLRDIPVVYDFLTFFNGVILNSKLLSRNKSSSSFTNTDHDLSTNRELSLSSSTLEQEQQLVTFDKKKERSLQENDELCGKKKEKQQKERAKNKNEYEFHFNNSALSSCDSTKSSSFTYPTKKGNLTLSIPMMKISIDDEDDFSDEREGGLNNFLESMEILNPQITKNNTGGGGGTGFIVSDGGSPLRSSTGIKSVTDKMITLLLRIHLSLSLDESFSSSLLEEEFDVSFNVSNITSRWFLDTFYNRSIFEKTLLASFIPGATTTTGMGMEDQTATTFFVDTLVQSISTNTLDSPPHYDLKDIITASITNTDTRLHLHAIEFTDRNNPDDENDDIHSEETLERELDAIFTQIVNVFLENYDELITDTINGFAFGPIRDNLNQKLFSNNNDTDNVFTRASGGCNDTSDGSDNQNNKKSQTKELPQTSNEDQYLDFLHNPLFQKFNSYLNKFLTPDILNKITASFSSTSGNNAPLVIWSSNNESSYEENGENDWKFAFSLLRSSIGTLNHFQNISLLQPEIDEYHLLNSIEFSNTEDICVASSLGEESKPRLSFLFQVSTMNSTNATVKDSDLKPLDIDLNLYMHVYLNDFSWNAGYFAQYDMIQFKVTKLASLLKSTKCAVLPVHEFSLYTLLFSVLNISSIELDLHYAFGVEEKSISKSHFNVSFDNDGRPRENPDSNDEFSLSLLILQTLDNATSVIQDTINTAVIPGLIHEVSTSPPPMTLDVSSMQSSLKHFCQMSSSSLPQDSPYSNINNTDQGHIESNSDTLSLKMLISTLLTLLFCFMVASCVYILSFHENPGENNEETNEEFSSLLQRVRPSQRNLIRRTSRSRFDDDFENYRMTHTVTGTIIGTSFKDSLTLNLSLFDFCGFWSAANVDTVSTHTENTTTTTSKRNTTGKLFFYARFAIPVVIICTIVLFITSNHSIGASVEARVDVLRTVPTSSGASHDTYDYYDFPELSSFSLGETVRNMWNAKVYTLALLVLIFSGVWPYTKLAVMLFAFLTPPPKEFRTLSSLSLVSMSEVPHHNRPNLFRRVLNRFLLNVSTRERLLTIVDVLGKFSLVDIYIMIFMMVAFSLKVPMVTSDENINSEGYPLALVTINLFVSPRFGFFSFVSATAISLFIGHVVLFIHHYYAVTFRDQKIHHTRKSQELRQAALSAGDGTFFTPLDASSSASQESNTDSSEDEFGNIVEQLKARKESLLDHHFVNHENKKHYKLSRPFRMFIVGLLAVSVVFLLVGIHLRCFHFIFTGFVGDLLKSDNSTAYAHYDSAMSSDLSRASYSIISIGKALPDSVKNPRGSGIKIIQFIFYFFSVIMPFITYCILICLFTLPMTLKKQRLFYMITETARSWTALDVFLFSTLLSVWQIGQFAGFMSNPYCEDFVNPMLKEYFFDPDTVKQDEQVCFGTKAETDWKVMFLCAGVIFTWVLNNLGLKLTHQAMRDRRNTLQQVGHGAEVEYEEDLPEIIESMLQSKIMRKYLLVCDDDDNDDDNGDDDDDMLRKMVGTNPPTQSFGNENEGEPMQSLMEPLLLS